MKYYNKKINLVILYYVSRVQWSNEQDKSQSGMIDVTFWGYQHQISFIDPIISV